MITFFDLIFLAAIAHFLGAIVAPLYTDVLDSLRSYRNARRIRRLTLVPVARAIPSFWIDQLAHLNEPTVTRRRRSLSIIDVG